MPWTNDPARDADRYDAEQNKILQRLPVCSDCGEHITDDYFYEINSEYICPTCLNDNYRKYTDDYIT